jgi:hypothetical protein
MFGGINALFSTKNQIFFRKISGKMLSLRHKKSIIYAHILSKTQERNRFAVEHFVLGRDSLPFLEFFCNSALLLPSCI